MTVTLSTLPATHSEFEALPRDTTEKVCPIHGHRMWKRAMSVCF